MANIGRQVRGVSGYATLTDPDLGVGHLKEADTFTCVHCNTIVHVNYKHPIEDLGGRCGVCDGLICRNCVATGKCEPLEKKLLRMEVVKRYF